MPIPTAPSRAIDAYPLLVAVRAALMADATIVASVTAIRPEELEPQDVEPYIVLTLVNAVRDADSTYDAPGVDAIIQATLVTKGAATILRTQLVPLMLIAVLDGNLVAAGYTIWSVEESDQRAYSDVTANVTRRYGALRFRLRATKP